MTRLTRTVFFPIGWLVGGALVILAFAAPAEERNRVAPLLKNIGDLHHAVTTSNATAQKYFDQGLTLTYAFNHLESERSFQQAAVLDPGMAMAYWGQALALGPNINDPIPDAEREHKAYEAIQKAKSLTAKASGPERELIGAMAARYSEKPERPKLNEAYAKAMTKVARLYPDDPDVQVLYADALMNTTPWDYWKKGGEPKPVTKEILATLERVTKQFPNHPGGHHFYIHAVEAAEPDRAEASADKLVNLVPVAGHLVHMPAHIYIRVGRYADAAEVNRQAIRADEDYITQCHAQGMYPVAYYPHNIHFLWAALTMQGHGAEAIETARQAASKHDHQMLSDPKFGFGHLLQTVPMFALVRFGKFDDVLAMPEPPSNGLFERGVWHFGRGMAFRAKNDVASGEQELTALAAIAARPELVDVKVTELNSLASLLRIGERTLAGEIAAAKGDYAAAEKILREGADAEDALLYNEPPDWPQPVRHSLGVVLLEGGRPAEAERVYREDLVRHRNNGWALFGLAQSLQAQGKTAEAQEVQRQFNTAWEGSDVKLLASRF